MLGFSVSRTSVWLYHCSEVTFLAQKDPEHLTVGRCFLLRKPNWAHFTSFFLSLFIYNVDIFTLYNFILIFIAFDYLKKLIVVASSTQICIISNYKKDVLLIEKYLHIQKCIKVKHKNSISPTPQFSCSFPKGDCCQQFGTYPAFPCAHINTYRSSLCPHKPIISWKYHKSRMRLIHLAYWTS